MREFIKPRLWLGIWLLGWLLCIVLSLITPPDISLDINNGDKIGHFFAYGLLSAWAVMLFPKKRAWMFSALALIGLGIAMEFAQGYFTTTRMMDWRDALADAVGVGMGLLFILLPAQNFLQRLDQKLFKA
ncbi:MAG: VanZ family protein [Arenimonas sp.]